MPLVPFPIVGIGASAGGIEALRGFFEALPPDTGMSFVVITHLSPDRESFLHDILGRFTAMRVIPLTRDIAVKPNTVHVMTPGTVLSIESGRIRVRALPTGQREPKPVDVFLTALANDRKENSVAIILSGGDGDGALGIKSIKAFGGLTLAQTDGDSGPRHSGMPDTARATGMVDFAIPAEEMPARLLEYLNATRLVESADANEPNGKFAPAEADIEIIFQILRSKVGHDFAGYKQNTFLRRLHRRMQIAGVKNLSDYTALLSTSAEEVRTLFHDLLINVTAFFRDPPAFAALAKVVIPKIFENHGSDGIVRVWVPGCATGEEVYTIAILIREYAMTLQSAPAVQIFATDIDEHALSVARAGRYPPALLESVSPERLRQFFRLDGGSYVLTKDIREICNFSPHSVLRDPPFSRIDLVSCRNLLIYLGQDAQAHVLPTFHYALRPSGYLFLGSSENVSQFSDLFSAVDKKHRIFRSRLEAKSMVKLPAVITGQQSVVSHEKGMNLRRMTSSVIDLRNAAEMRVLERFAPAHVIVNGDGDVVHFSARTGRFLEASAGVPSRQLLTMARKGLRLDLRAAFRETIETGRTATRPHVMVEGDGDRVQSITLTIEPFSLRNDDGAFYLVIFSENGELSSESASASQSIDPIATQLERELQDTRDRLQSMVEEYETALEELKSSNEELISVNEELQSSNEELEASKEELQSLNEELHTVNAELGGKVDALDLLNADLNNLFESTRVATIFLDRDLVIRSFTPAASQIFNVRSSDHGRPLTDLSSRMVLPGLKDDVDKVLAEGQLIERQIVHEAGSQHFLIKIAPYLTQQKKIDGVVMSFVDVTSLTQAEAQRRVLNLELNHRVKNMLAVVIGIARQMEKSVGSPKIASATFVNRLHAMSRAFEVLSHENWAGASVEMLVKGELEPHDRARIELDGPSVRLFPNQALSMGMVLHELTANSARYGALASQTGKILINWRLEGEEKDRRVVLNWSERVETEIVPPERYGFGLKIIEREGANNLNGKTVIEFSKHGLDVHLSFPIVGNAVALS